MDTDAVDHAVPVTPGGSLAAEQEGLGVYSWNLVTAELSWDERLARVFGAEAGDETALDTWRRRVDPQDQARVVATLCQIRAGLAPEEAQEICRLVLADGSVRHVLGRVTEVARAPDGTPITVVGVMVDLSGPQVPGGRLAAMLDSISDGFLLLDYDYRFVYVNRQAETILGRRSAELVGHSLWEMYPHAQGTAFDDVYHRVMETRVGDRFEEYYPEPLNMWLEVRAEPCVEGMVIYFRDVTESRARRQDRERLLEAERQARWEADRARESAERAWEQLAYQATHDALTGLVNRWEFERLARAALDEVAGSPTRTVTVLFLDLDRFKLVNDSLGHGIGDRLLMEVGRLLSTQIRPGDVLARLGGDEFVVLLKDARPEDAQLIAERIRAAVLKPLVVAGHALSTTVSIGLASAGAGTTVETLLRNADVALYRAKDCGRNSISWFDVERHRELLERIELEADLQALLQSGGLAVHYQSIFDLRDGRLAGVEALARWTHPERGDIPPCVFVPLAEDVGLICELGSSVLAAACRQAAEWRDLPDFTVWVNVSGREFVPGYAKSVLATVRRAGLAPERIGLEVTESVLADEAVAVRELAVLHTAGIRVAIDDFGTGYSSLARLAMLPITVLKIDRSFVAAIDTDLGRATVDVVVHLAGVLGVRTVAEGVETPTQLQLLRNAGVDSAAGFLLGRPAPAGTKTTGSALLASPDRE